jgi:hypothetical protein
MNGLRYRVLDYQREHKCDFPKALAEVFKSADADQSGFVDEEEWVQFIVREKMGTSKAQARGIFFRLASYGRGVGNIDLDQLGEFIGGPPAAQKPTRRSSVVQAAMASRGVARSMMRRSSRLIIPSQTNDDAPPTASRGPFAAIKRPSTANMRTRVEAIGREGGKAADKVQKEEQKEEQKEHVEKTAKDKAILKTKAVVAFKVVRLSEDDTTSGNPMRGLPRRRESGLSHRRESSTAGALSPLVDVSAQRVLQLEARVAELEQDRKEQLQLDASVERAVAAALAKHAGLLATQLSPPQPSI